MVNKRAVAEHDEAVGLAEFIPGPGERVTRVKVLSRRDFDAMLDALRIALEVVKAARSIETPDGMESYAGNGDVATIEAAIRKAEENSK